MGSTCHRLLVVGAGATGGYFGGRLAAAGRDVTFLVRPRRAEQLAETGLEIVSPHGDLSLTPRLVTPGHLDATYDLVLLAVKSYALDAAIEDLAPAVGPSTFILPVLNGIAHLDRLRARFGQRGVLGGACVVIATLDGDGRILQLSGLQELAYGDLLGGDAEGVAALDGDLIGAGFAARRSACIELEMWEKWATLATLGAATCLMRGSVGQIVAAPGGRELVEGLLGECAAVAAASGHVLRDAALARTRGLVTEAGSALTSSMYRDLVQGGRIEGDHIVGDLVARAGALGVAVPLLSIAYTHLAVYERRSA